MLATFELMNIWDEVMQEFGYPPLPDPVLSDDSAKVSTASIQMINHRIYMNTDFIESLVEKGLDRELTAKALLMHEVGHYMVCPFDFITLYKLLKEGYLKFHDMDRAKMIQNFYTDMVVNRHIYIEKDCHHIKDILLTEQFDGYIGELLQEYYRIVIDLPLPQNSTFKAKMVPFLKSELDKSTDYHEKYKTFLDLFFDPKTMQNQDLDNPYGENHDEGESTLSHTFSLKAFSDAESTDGQNQIQNEIPDNTYNRMVKQRIFKSEGQSNPQTPAAPAQCNGQNSGDDEDDIFGVIGGLAQGAGSGGDIQQPYTYSLEHYEELLDEYRIRIEESEIQTNPENIIESSYEDWTVDRSPTEVNIYASYGKFLPGLSKCFVNTGETVAEDSDKKNMVLPDCLIAMDSSGSMVDPNYQLSYALLGAFCTTREYIENDRSVGCVNFSDSTMTLDFTEDEDEVFSFLGHFQGGGTTVDTKAIEELVESNNNPVDIILISDMELGNFQDTIDFLATLENNNRIYIFKIDQSYSTPISNLPENVQLYSIKNPEDIASIIIQESADWF
ncbi:VWA domain-containing protein [bacterium]|nr:VWA domain-containing protein [bacterium]